MKSYLQWPLAIITTAMLGACGTNNETTSDENSSTASEIVTDTATHLQWQDNNDASMVVEPWLDDNKTTKEPWLERTTTYTQCAAGLGTACSDNLYGDTAASYCHNLTLGGYSDWRLPTIDELEPMMSNPNQYTIFQHMGAKKYWTNTETLYATSAWAVGKDENRTREFKNILLNVRCVRGGVTSDENGTASNH
ncbi:MAG: DUF1566 domain-containing protein [Sulfurovum sp.]|nr:DUF1566 domain-containing protein [Sulfurovum sp.]MCB4773864.1 DUF1566 domain-containing protein [Sulfurovum sp.]